MLDNFMLIQNATIRDALAKLEKSKEKILIIVDNDTKVVGTITDGDIRRGLIKGISLDMAVENVMNAQPKLAQNNEDLSKYLDDLKQNLYRHIVIVDEHGRFQKILTADTVNDYNKNNNFTAVIMAGGRGSRLGNITKKTPKPMLKIGGKTMLERLIIMLQKNGYSKIIISVNYLKHVIMEYIKDGSQFGVEVTYIEENKPLGTAGALHFLPSDIDDNFMVINADLVTNCDFQELMLSHISAQNIATICVREYQYQIPFGVVEIDDTHHVVDIEEKPIKTSLIASGVYILNKDVLQYVPHNSYFDMPDLIRTLVQHGKVGVFTIFESWYDVGRPEELDHVREIFSTREAE